MSVLGNCSLHGLSERKTYQMLYGNRERTFFNNSKIMYLYK